MENHDSDGHSARQPGRWSSGRLLSENARQKKRENDRRSKANARKRDREHTQDLEARLEELTVISDDQTLQIEALRQRINMLEDRNGQYRKNLEHLMVAPNEQATQRPPLQPHEVAAYSNFLQNHNQQSLADWRNQLSHFAADENVLNMARAMFPADGGSTHWVPSQQQQQPPPQQQQQQHAMGGPMYGIDVGQQSYPASSATLGLSSQHHTEQHQETLELGSLADALSMYIYHLRELNVKDVCFDEQYTQDALVRIAVWGQFDNTNNCPVLDLIAQGERAFSRFIQPPLMEKLAVIRQAHRLMLYNVCKQGTEIPGMPEWYKPTKLQRRKKHEALIDYIPWPEFRDRVVLGLKSPQLDAKFWIYCSLNFRILSDVAMPTHAFQSNPDGGYSFTEAFEEVIKDIGNWRMRTAFFEQYPELFGDIPSDNAYRPRVDARGNILPHNHDTAAGTQNNSHIDRGSMNTTRWP